MRVRVGMSGDLGKIAAEKKKNYPFYNSTPKTGGVTVLRSRKKKKNSVYNSNKNELYLQTKTYFYENANIHPYYNDNLRLLFIYMQ